MSIIDSTDPGLVNVANQGWPIPPPDFQDLPTPDNIGTPVDWYGPPPTTFQDEPTPLTFSAPSYPPPPARSVVAPFIFPPPDHSIALQPLYKGPVAEFMVGADGPFQTNITDDVSVSLTIANVVVTPGPGGPTDPATLFTLYFTTNLDAFGLSLVNRPLNLPNSADPSEPNNIPARPIIYATRFSLIVQNGDPLYNLPLVVAPVIGNIASFDIQRQGSEVTNKTVNNLANVFILPPPPIGLTVSAAPGKNMGNITPTSGVVLPYIGEGLPAPPFLGTFYVANQSPAIGLPVNVYPG